jgi:hypothetical protein
VEFVGILLKEIEMRARNIKPAFFTNELLGTLEPIIALTFTGLWCLADRDGILEDRPLRIKAELFPYRESLDVNGYLTVLERTGFISRYEVDDIKYIEVLNFRKHQAPHHTEKAKGYPSNPLKTKVHRYLSVIPPIHDSEQQVPTRSDSLIPDSLIPDSIKELTSLATAKDLCPQKEIIEIYHNLLPMMPSVREWTPTRQAKLRARWNEKSDRQNLDWWKRFFDYVSQSDFLCGRTSKPFTCNLEWLITPSNFAKVVEGNYDNRSAQ